MPTANDPTTRFTGRAAIYQASRPGYPSEIIPFLAEHAGLGHRTRVLDLGTGTGKFAALLLESGAEVTGLEPNNDMRNQAVKSLSDQPLFHAMAMRAESTILPDASYDLATAAQAYHWFDEEAVAKEIVRVVRPPHLLFAVWNEREAGSDFNKTYDSILNKHGDSESRSIRNQHSFPSILRAESIVEFHGSYVQELDLQGLIQRAESNSGFALGSEEARNELTELFDAHQNDGLVAMRYRTVGWLGEVSVG